MINIYCYSFWGLAFFVFSFHADTILSGRKMKQHHPICFPSSQQYSFSPSPALLRVNLSFIRTLPPPNEHRLLNSMTLSWTPSIKSSPLQALRTFRQPKSWLMGPPSLPSSLSSSPTGRHSAPPLLRRMSQFKGNLWLNSSS